MTERQHNINQVAGIIAEHWSPEVDDSPRAFAEKHNPGGWGFDVRYGHEGPGSWTRVEGLVLSPADLNEAVEQAEEWEAMPYSTPEEDGRR